MNKLDGEFGTFLDVSDDQSRRLLWSNQLDWITCRGADTADRVRYMEVFLDAVAAYASTDSSWLLDPRFEGLLIAVARSTTAIARDLFAAAGKVQGSSMKPLVEALERLGAGGV